MKNKRFLILSLLFIGIALTVYGQNKRSDVDVEKQTRDAIYSGVGIDWVSDTIVINKDSVLFFKNTPLIFFDGYSKLFTSDEGVLVMPYIGEKGYYCKWIIKDKQLYLKNISFSTKAPEPNGKNDNIGYTKFEKDKDGKLVVIDVLLPSQSTAKSRLEKLTSRKFDKDGLLKADWMTGNFIAYSVQHAFSPYNDEKKNNEHRDRKFNDQKQYRLWFSKGELNKIEFIKDGIGN